MDVIAGIVPHATNKDFDKDNLFEAWLCADENPHTISPDEAAKQMESIKHREEAETVRKGRQWLQRIATKIKTELSSLEAAL